MPRVEVVTEPLASSEAALLVVGAFAAASGERSDPPELADDAAAIASAADLDLLGELTLAGFDAAPGSSYRVPTRAALPAPSVLVVGLGPRAEADLDRLRRAGAAAANAAERVETLASSLHIALGDDEVGDAAQALVEGMLLGSYRYTDYRTDPDPFELRSIALHADDDSLDAVRSATRIAEIVTGAATLARDLVNTPPQAKRPPALAEQVVAEVADLPIEVRVLDEVALEQEGYGGILGVGRGSSAPPRLVELGYAPQDASAHVALVGKGITFDTGGISLKPAEAMETMKLDMAGAAAVLATIKAAAQLGLAVRVTGLLALAENMPSGGATRVSDVLTFKDGTTVEVTNTDAEGRLVLADALVRARELKPDAIVDVATLTGAATVALGERIGVLMASDDELATALLRAGERCGERIWQLPLATEEYGERLEGAIADLKNSGTRAASTIFGGLFLHRFAGEEIPWAHLDIAGTAWSDEAYGYVAKGGTGVPTRTLLGWLRTLPAPADDLG